MPTKRMMGLVMAVPFLPELTYNESNFTQRSQGRTVMCKPKRCVMKRIIMLLLVGLIVGCSGTASKQASIDMQAADSVEFIRPYELSRNDVTFVSLGEVSGESCQANFWSHKATQEQALLKMKVAAANLGANRVVLRQCTQDSSENCSARWLCVGNAHQQQPLR